MTTWTIAYGIDLGDVDGEARDAARRVVAASLVRARDVVVTRLADPSCGRVFD